MAIPRSKESKALLSVCHTSDSRKPRFSSKQSRPTGAVYLAGYGIECILKALILSIVPPERQRTCFRPFGEIERTITSG